jgi:small subunit ribosomal protein S28e
MAEVEDAKAGQQAGGKPEQQAPPAKPAPGKQADANTKQMFDGYLAEVVDVVRGRTGIYGEIKQAMCRIMEGKDKGRVIRRNIAGKIRKGDMIRLPDTSREDKKIMAR